MKYTWNTTLPNVFTVEESEFEVTFFVIFFGIHFFTQRIGFFYKKMIFYKTWPKEIGGEESEAEFVFQIVFRLRLWKKKLS